MTAGRVRVFRQDRGFGFITPDDDSYDIFVRAADVEGTSGSALVEGEPVEYQPAIGMDGQLRAAAVRPLRASQLSPGSVGDTLDSTSWLGLCFESLGVPADRPDQERRRLAERALLEATGQPIDILGIGAAEVAIDLVVRYGEAGELDELMLRWEQAEFLPSDITTLGDEGDRRATICAKKLLSDIVAYTENRPG